MQLGLRRLVIATVFLTWVLPRVFPLLMYPGVYCFDTWFFMAHAESILIWNRIPPLNPIEYWYIPHPALYLFAVQITFIFGTTLIDSFRIFAVILIFSGFFTFFTLFRRLLGSGWPSIIAMLLFSVSVDVIAQTYCVIQENLALTFLALILLTTLKLTQKKIAKTELLFVLPILILVIAMTHHLTTFFAALFTFSIILASILHQNNKIRKNGIIIGTVLTLSLVALILLLNPIMSIVFLQYDYITFPALLGAFVICFLLFFGRKKIWQLFESLKQHWSKITFIFLGIACGGAFFFSTIIFYPYDRSLLWIAIKFGLFSLVLGLSISVMRILPWLENKKRINGLFILFSILILGISFIFTGVATIIYVELEIIRIELALSYRHFAFLLLPLAFSATIALIGLKKCQKKSKKLPNRLLLPSIALLLLIFSSASIYNLYVPAGGWYPEWCDHAEINTGIWLKESANYNSTIVTDRRLIKMMSGINPIDSEKFNIVWLDPSYLSNPSDVLNDLYAYKDNVYFFTSDLSESHFILEFLHPPIYLDCSTMFNQASSLTKTYDRNHATLYWLTS